MNSLRAFLKKKCSPIQIKSDVHRDLSVHAEAWAKRRYEKHFISKLTDTDGEQQETEHWIKTESDCNYLSAKQTKDWLNWYASVGRMLSSMTNKAAQFCS